MSAQCPECGFEGPEGLSFCGLCGSKLSAPPAATADDDREAAIHRMKEAGDRADADLQDMLGIARRAGDGTRLSEAVSALAHQYLARRQYELARPLLEEAVSLLRTQADRAGEAAALAGLAHLNWRAGRFETVADAFQRAHELRRRAGEPAGMARSYFDLGLLYRDGLSRPFHAVGHFEKAIELARHSGDADLETLGLVGLGISWTRLGDYAQARTVFEQARQKADEIRSAEQVAWVIVAQASALRETGSFDARSTVGQALAPALEVDAPDLRWHALLEHARISQAAGAWSDAQLWLERMQALERSGQVYAYCAMWSYALLARSYLHTGRRDQAAASSEQAVTLLQSQGFTGVPMPQMILWVHYEVMAYSDAQSAVHFLRQARELMLSQANTIGDGALRAHFLRDVAINRAIGDDWARRHS
jgi:tetratricopeptide (TPR) repeat protein